MAKQSPKYRGIYAYVAANKPDGVTIKANPKYRGIYAYDATNKPSGVALDAELFAASGGNVETTTQLEQNVPSSVPATGSTTDDEGEAVEPAPWDTMTTHNQLDTYMNDNTISYPAGWSSMTIAQKKAWLDDNG